MPIAGGVGVGVVVYTITFSLNPILVLLVGKSRHVS
jgi:hypothetical protein